MGVAVTVAGGLREVGRGCIDSLAASAAKDGLWEWEAGHGHVYVSERCRELAPARPLSHPAGGKAARFSVPPNVGADYARERTNGP